MSQTIDIVENLQEQFQGWNADGAHGVLRFIDQAHTILMAQESNQNVLFSEATGKLPALNTTDAVYSYTLEENVWRLGGVLVEVGVQSELVNTLNYYDYGMRRATRQHPDYVTLGGIDYTRIPYVRSWDWMSDDQPARLMFTKNPGTETDVYYLWQWKRPTAILSVNVQHEVPPPWDLFYLQPAAAKLIEGIQNGNYMDAMAYIRDVIKPALWNQMNSGEQSEDDEPVDRGF